MAEANKDERTLIMQEDDGTSTTHVVADMSPQAQSVYNKLVVVQNEITKVTFDLEKLNFAQMGYIGTIKPLLNSDEETEDNEDGKKQNTK